MSGLCGRGFKFMPLYGKEAETILDGDNGEYIFEM